MNILTKYITGRCTVLWTLSLATLLASCVRDDFPTCISGPDDGNSVRVEILLHTPEAGAPTRSLTDDDEISVKDVLVLFFDQEGLQLHSVSQGRQIAPQPSAGGKVITFETSFSVENSLAGKKFECVVLANVAAMYSEDARAAWRGKSYDALQQELTQAVTDRLYTDNIPATFGGIPMWGKARLPLEPSRPNQSLDVPILRSVARVDVDVDEDVTNFTLDEVYIYKPNDALSLMPAWSSYNEGELKVAFPSVPDGAQAFADKWQYNIAGDANRIARTIYIPEADVVQNGNGTPGDAHHLNRCAIVVGGKYSGGSSATYYRIDFKHGEGDAAKGKLMDVLRNHRYAVNITRVSGAGESSPDAAYESRTASIEAEVITWTDNNQNIVFDGADWASVERKEVHFGDGEGSHELLQLLSSVKPSEWKLQFSVPEESIMGPESTVAIVSGTYFEVVKPADNSASAEQQGGYLTIRTRQSLPEYNVDTPSVKNEPLHEVLTVRIGRLELKIDLYQHPYADTEWDDGGSIEGGF